MKICAFLTAATQGPLLSPYLQYPQRHLCSLGMELEELFHEYEAGETPEARLVKDFDKARP